MDSKGSYVFDDISRSVIHAEGRVSPEAVSAGRSFQQAMVNRYGELGRMHTRRD